MRKLNTTSARYLTLIVLLAVLSLLLGSARVEVAAQGPWIQNPDNGHYYRLTQATSWTEAEAQAIAWGGHLATLDNPEEEAWVEQTFGETEHFWIGFNDIGEEGVWVWSSGRPVVYTNWAPGEPNNTVDEDAAVINWMGNYWNDIHVGEVFRGVAETNNLIFLPIVLKRSS
jgi:hypothetical protein